MSQLIGVGKWRIDSYEITQNQCGVVLKPLTRCSLLENPSRMSNVPGAPFGLEAHKNPVVQRRQVFSFARNATKGVCYSALMHNLENPPAPLIAILLGVVVALSRV